MPGTAVSWALFNKGLDDLKPAGSSIYVQIPIKGRFTACSTPHLFSQIMTAAIGHIIELAQSAAPPDALEVHVHVWHLPTNSDSSSSSAASVASSTASASRPDPTTSTTPSASTATSKPKPKSKTPSHQSTLNMAKRRKTNTETQERVVAAMDTYNKLIVNLVTPTTPTKF